MIRVFGLTLVALAAATLSAQAEGLKCGKFQKNADGSWTPKEAMAIRGPRGTVELDVRTAYKVGSELPGLNFDLAAALNAECK